MGNSLVIFFALVKFQISFTILFKPLIEDINFSSNHHLSKICRSTFIRLEFLQSVDFRDCSSLPISLQKKFCRKGKNFLFLEDIYEKPETSDFELVIELKFSAAGMWRIIVGDATCAFRFWRRMLKNELESLYYKKPVNKESF